jgi:hypothetical protein
MRKCISAMALGAVLALSLAGAAFANGNGSSTDMPAFYDCELHTVNFKLVTGPSPTGPQINNIYVFPQLPNFEMVIDQITGGENTNPPPHNGFNPLWQLVNVTFTTSDLATIVRAGLDNVAGQESLGLCTDNCIFPAPLGAGPPDCVNTFPLTLTPTGMVFRCSVVGQKSPKGP